MQTSDNPLSDIKPIPEVTREDVKAALRGLTAGKYPARMLYARYVEVMAAQDREPASAIAFGKMIGEYGGMRTSAKVNGQKVRAWHVVEPYFPPEPTQTDGQREMAP